MQNTEQDQFHPPERGRSQQHWWPSCSQCHCAWRSISPWNKPWWQYNGWQQEGLRPRTTSRTLNGVWSPMCKALRTRKMLAWSVVCSMILHVWCAEVFFELKAVILYTALYHNKSDSTVYCDKRALGMGPLQGHSIDLILTYGFDYVGICTINQKSQLDKLNDSWYQ